MAVLGLLSAVPPASAFKRVDVGQEAPDFSLKNLAGETVHLHDKLGAKVLAVAFWATWSPRSQTLLEDLELTYRELREKGFEALAVNIDRESVSADEMKTIRDWAARSSFPSLLDEGLGVFSTYGVVAVPSVILLNKEGTIQYLLPGYATSARIDLREEIEKLLGIYVSKAEKLGIKLREYVPPKKATLHYQKALILIQRGMPKKAIRDFEEAASLDPNWAEPRLGLARILVSEAKEDPQNLARAEALTREALAIGPNHVQTLAWLAEVLLAEGRHTEALSAADEALTLSPSHTPALLVKSRAYRLLGKLEPAAVAIAEALRLDPKNPRLLAEKGQVAVAQGRWEAAAAAFREAVELALEEAANIR
ncbi:MAG: tetratricopeptide repeat protein [Deltaproteobacteria bacterium]|nr:tetratricopeptide repeat protein [Deltaproteobacteria bacterium]